MRLAAEQRRRGIDVFLGGLISSTPATCRDTPPPFDVALRAQVKEHIEQVKGVSADSGTPTHVVLTMWLTRVHDEISDMTVYNSKG